MDEETRKELNYMDERIKTLEDFMHKSLIGDNSIMQQEINYQEKRTKFENFLNLSPDFVLSEIEINCIMRKLDELFKNE